MYYRLLRVAKPTPNAIVAKYILSYFEWSPAFGLKVSHGRGDRADRAVDPRQVTGQLRGLKCSRDDRD